MASQTLETLIRINGQVGSGFYQIGSTLTSLGIEIDRISQKLINFGKESVTVYRDYEKSMADARVALSTTYGHSTKELNDVMAELHVSATEWAATTKFHTNDVANAISEAAHAGWDLEQIMTGLPAAMQLAQAGGLDLSEAVNYIVKSTSAAGVEFGDMADFIDLWAFSANSSASTIGEFGEAMLKMGSTMRFAGNTEELMTLLAVTANAGTVGSMAGTLIRNSILRLVAPTKNARSAMADLGATSEETGALLEDEALAAANAELAAHGFSAFDEDGQMKHILDIYREMYVALGEIAGGYDNIGRNEKALGILSAIFPTRTITEALTLLNGAAEGYDGLYEAMMGGDATGYGQYAAATMMDTLDGKIEIFESKVERLQQLVGEELSGQVEAAAGFMGQIVDNLAAMDEEKFSALVQGLEVIALAGPGLIGAGIAFRIIGTLLNPAGAVVLGLTALTAAAAAIKELEEADFKDNFGNMELDTESIKSYVQTIGEDFKNAWTEVDNFKNALDNAVTSYESASSTFSAKIFQDMLTGATLTEDEKSVLMTLGEQMYTAVQAGVANSTAESLGYWQVLFGGADAAAADPAFQEIYSLIDTQYMNSITEIETISRDMRQAMLNAFEDNEITEEEYQTMLGYMRSYNEAMARAAAEAQAEEDYIKTQRWLQKAQTASLDEIQELANTATSERDQLLADEQERFETEYFSLQYRGEDAETLSRTRALHDQRQQRINAAYDNFLYTLWDSQLRQSGQAGNYETLMEYAGQYLSGMMSADAINAMIGEQMGGSIYAGASGYTGPGSTLTNSDRAQLGRLMGYIISSMGGNEGVESRIAHYEETGQEVMAEQLRMLYAMEQLINNFGTSEVLDNPILTLLNPANNYTNSNIRGTDPGQTAVGANRSAAEAALGTGAYSQALRELEALRAEYETLSAEADAAKERLENNKNDWSYGIWGGRTHDEALVYGTATQQGAQARLDAMQDEILALESLVEDLKGGQGLMTQGYQGPPIVVPITPKVEGEDSMTALQEQGVTVDVGANDTELQATIDGADGQTLVEYLRGNATDLHMTIMDEDGQTLTEIVKGNVTDLDRAIRQYQGRVITVNIAGAKLFAEGGRATDASIFGEDGPEWAIPEEHSARTASLLDAARAASGFTWEELLTRNGGLNAGGGQTTIIYSPTINATDAGGLERVLRDDKRRLEKWFEEKTMRDGAEVYA